MYGLIGLNTSPAALPVFLLIGCIMNLVSHKLSVVFVHATPIQDAAMVSCTFYGVVSIMLTGVLVNWRDMSPFWNALSHVTPGRYAVGALVKELLQVCPCSADHSICCNLYDYLKHSDIGRKVLTGLWRDT